jgi:PAS domain S-box-containing protein
VILLVALLIGTLLLKRFIENITQPLSNLASKAEKVSFGDFGQPIETHSEDEVNDLAQSFNRMLANLKQSHHALSKSEEKYRYLVENINDVIYATDSSGVITYISPAIEAVLGYQPKEVIGRHMNDYVYEEDLLFIKERFQEVLDGELGPSEYRLRDNSGEIRWVRSSSRPIVENKIVVGMQGVFVDISERKQAEEELRNSREQLRNLASHLQSARETERKSIAREIHDELGPTLTGLKMDLSWLSEKIPKEEPLLKKIQAMINLTDININTVRRISAELRPGTLDVLGLMAALEWQAEEFQNRTGIECNLITVPEEISLDEKLSTDLFRIFQEIITNVARHARATKVTASFKKKNEYLELKVKDNGRGITAEQISDPTSFGLIGIRERIHPWRGKVAISGGPNKGTTVTVRVPS